MENRLTAVGHPLRIKILGALQESDEPLSPREIATELGESLGNVSYHVRSLDALGCIVLVDWRKVRGAVQHFYRPTISATFDGDCVSLKPADPMPTAISVAVVLPQTRPRAAAGGRAI
jgi:predicted transcriptional regulator